MPEGVCHQFYKLGKCDRGGSCKFKHEQKKGVKPPGAVPPALQGEKSSDGKSHGKGGEATPSVPEQKKLSPEENRVKLAEEVLEAKSKARHEENLLMQVQSGTGYSTKVGAYFQRLQRFETGLFLSESTQRTLKRVYPHVQFVPKTQGEVILHSHPILNMEREMAEAHAYDYCLTLMEKSSVQGTIVDVGGNMDRHVRKGRTSKKSNPIHSCNPILDSADVLRSLNHQGHKNTCKHIAQDCTCVSDVGIYLSVDSLYYLQVEDISKMCMKALSRSMVAVCHEFPDAYGSFAEGEANYQQLADDTVSMSVAGNSHAYVHSNLAWMRQNCAEVLKDGVRIGTLCWSKLTSFPYHAVYVFHFTPLIMTPSKPLEVSFSSALLDPNHFGPVSMSALNEKAKTAVGGDCLSVPDVRVYSWGTFVFVYKTSERVNIMCPKGFVSECAVRVAGQVRSPDNFRNLVAWAKFKASAYNIPPHLLSSCLFAVASLAFIQDLHFETGILHGLLKPVRGVIEKHENAINRKYKWVWTFEEVVAAVTVTGVLTTAVGAAVHAAGVALGPVTGVALAAGGIATLCAAACASKFGKSDEFQGYRANRSSNGPRTAVIPLPRGTQLPATDPVKTVEELMKMPMDPSASVEIRDPMASKEATDAPIVRPGNASAGASLIADQIKRGILREPRPLRWEELMPLMPAGIITDIAIPVVPSNTSHSAISTIHERIVKCGPYGRMEVDGELFSKFRHWVRQNLPELGLYPGCVKRISFDDWNVVYAKGKREEHKRALHQVTCDDSVLVDRIHNRKLFTKIESLSKSTEDGVAKLAPRGIQAGSDIHNVVTGRFCKSFSGILKRVWSVASAKGLMYTSGASAEDIGRAFEQSLENCPGYSLLEGDFARFDSTIHRFFLELEAEIYSWLGCSPREFAAFMQCINTKGMDKWKNKYKVDGGRHSGDHNTSCGNTLIQGLAIMFCLAYHHATLNDGVLPSYVQLCEMYHLAMFALGDDNLLVAPDAFLASLGPDVKELVKLLRRLGLELEPKLHVGPNARYHASFCSAHFYPVEGGCVLAPGVGRGLAKSGYYVNPPAGVAVEQLLRADAIGKRQDCWFVPFLGPMWKRTLELTQQFSGKEVVSKDLARQKLHNAHASKTFEANSQTYEMVEAVWGLTRADEEEYKKLLVSVKTLPCICTMTKFRAAAIADGMVEDVRAEAEPLVEEEKYPSPQPLPERDPVVWCTTCKALTVSACSCSGDLPSGQTSQVARSWGARFRSFVSGEHSGEYHSVMTESDECLGAHGVVSQVWDS